MMVDNVYILDNGAHTAKVELSKATAPRIIPNCIMKAKSERRRPFIGDQVEECRDASGLFYLLPFQKGFLINWDVQKTVWDYIFSKECCYGNFTETPLIVTEPYFNFPSIQEAMSEIFFEEYECQSLLRINANCEVKEEVQQLIQVLQFHDASNYELDYLESESYILRYVSLKVTHDEGLKRILWGQNRNPLLQHSFCSVPFLKTTSTCKQLWRAKVCNLPDEVLLSELDLIPTIHLCMHIKGNKQNLLSNLCEIGYEHLFDLENNLKSEPVMQSKEMLNSVAFEHASSQHVTSNNCENIFGHRSLIEHITQEEFYDSNDEPVNYGLKYFEQEVPTILDSVEQPINFSLKYLEEMENESAECVMMIFGAGETCYAETDLDHPPDAIFNCLEREDALSCREVSDFNHVINYAPGFAEEPKEYQVEGTPCDFSVGTPLSGICSPAFLEETKMETGKSGPTIEVIHSSDSNKTETEGKQNEGIVLETPLMFSRCSSVSSLASVEPSDDVRSVISDYSRMASGMISPSDLPDSPTQTTMPNIPNFRFNGPQKLRSVFEEKVNIFREESTPAQFSTTSSLSALSFDENQWSDLKEEVKFKNQSVVLSEAASVEGQDDDDDILAACISAGMQNGKSESAGTIKSEKSEALRKISDFYNFLKMSRKIPSKTLTTSPVSKNEALCDTAKTAEDITSNICNMTKPSDQSNVPEDSDHTDILAECIQAGMPKALGRSKCSAKKSAKIPLKFREPKDPSLQNHNLQKPSCSNNTTKINKATNDSFPVKSGSTVRASQHNNNVTPESYSPLDIGCDIKLQLSRRSSIDSIKEDSTEDQVTLSELLLLEQCISSGMPKKKTR